MKLNYIDKKKARLSHTKGYCYDYGAALTGLVIHGGINPDDFKATLGKVKAYLTVH